MKNPNKDCQTKHLSKNENAYAGSLLHPKTIEDQIVVLTCSYVLSVRFYMVLCKFIKFFVVNAVEYSGK